MNAAAASDGAAGETRRSYFIIKSHWLMGCLGFCVPVITPSSSSSSGRETGGAARLLMVWCLLWLGLQWLTDSVEGSDELAAKRQEGLHFLSAVISHHFTEVTEPVANQWPTSGQPVTQLLGSQLNQLTAGVMVAHLKRKIQTKSDVKQCVSWCDAADSGFVQMHCKYIANLTHVRLF